MDRTEFLKKLIRYTLFGLLAGVAVITGRKVVISGNECSSCRGNGICAGVSDCNKFLSVKNGDKK